MPAVSLTDHGSMAGAVQLFKAAKGTGVKPIIGCEVYVADDRRAQKKGYAHLTLLAADNEGYCEPDQALEPRLPRGLLLQAARRLGAARAALGRGDRALGLPLGPRLQGARGEPGHGRRRRARPARPGLRPRRRLRRAAERPPRGPGSGSCRSSSSWPPPPGSRRSRPAMSTTSATRTRARTRRCSASSRATR